MSLTATPTPTASPARQATRWQHVLHAREFPVCLVLVALLAVTSLLNGNFLSHQGRIDLMISISVTALLATGETFVIVMKHVDLSVGSTLGFAGLVAAKAAGPHGNLAEIVVIACLVGLGVGLVNGFLVSWLRLPSLVVTLGSLYIVQGLLAVAANSKQVTTDQLPPRVVDFGEKAVLGVPWLMWVALVVAVVAGWFMHTKRAGRDLYAIGSNGPAALLVGIPVRRREVMAFAISGTCAGLAGVLFLSRFGGLDANAGLGYELPTIAACVVGGVSIAGGNGTVFGAFVGAALLLSIGAALSALNVPEFWQQAVNGTLLILAITADRVAAVRRERLAAKQVVS